MVVTIFEGVGVLSPPPTPDTILLNKPLDEGFTVKFTTEDVLPTDSVLLVVQVTICPIALQFHPFPVATTNFNPEGRESVTVIFPAVGTEPIFFTLIL